MSNLSAFPYIQEGAEAVPALWNTVYSVLSSNLASLNTDLTSGHFQQLSIGSTPPSYSTTAAVTIEVNSTQSDYLYLVDSAAQRSSYIIGSRAGGTADGLNIWDVSGATMIVSFSKQSVRFFQQVVGPVFDVGGALADTLNAATFGTGADSKESRIQAAISAASIAGIARVYVPASMYPYSAASISFTSRVAMVREGGADWTTVDVRAYGAAGDNVRDDTAAFNAAMAATNNSGRARVYVPSGKYKLTSTVTIPVTVRSLVGVGRGNGTTQTGGAEIHCVVNDDCFRGAGNRFFEIGYLGILDDLAVSARTQGAAIRLDGHTGSLGIVDFSITDLDIGNFYDGLYLSQAFVGSITNVRSTSCKRYGFNLDPVCTSLTFYGTYANACGSHGYFINGGSRYLAFVAAASDGNLGNAYHIGRTVTEGTTDDVTFSSPGAENNIGHGIYVLDSNGVTITSAHLLGCGGDGIRLDGAVRTSIVGGTLFNNTGYGVSILTSATPQTPVSNYVINLNLQSNAAGNFNDPNLALSRFGGGSASLAVEGDLNLGSSGAPSRNVIIDGATGSVPSILFRRAGGDSVEIVRPAGIDAMSLQVANVEKMRLTTSVLSTNVPQIQQLPTSSNAQLELRGGSASQSELKMGSDAAAKWSVYVPSGSSDLHFYDQSLGQESVQIMYSTGAVVHRAGTALAPTVAYSSESSLGWYRSAASTMALSYGTLWPQGSLWVTSGISTLASIVSSSYVSSTKTLMGGDFWGSSLSINVGLNVKAGTNKSCGTAVLGSNGSVNVANTYVATGDLIFLTDQTPGGTLGDLEMTGIRNASGFTIASTSITDSSTVAWLIVRPT